MALPLGVWLSTRLGYGTVFIAGAVPLASCALVPGLPDASGLARREPGVPPARWLAGRHGDRHVRTRGGAGWGGGFRA